MEFAEDSRYLIDPDVEYAELVRRLRNLAWPRPRPSLRLRILNEIRRRFSE